MGSYGIGPARIMTAAIEQHHDDQGIAWPPSLTPYDVTLVAIGSAGPEASGVADDVAGALEAEGLDVLVDDRELRPGEKFADADLIGCSLRVTVGKKTLEDGKVDLRVRASGDEERVDAESGRRAGARAVRGGPRGNRGPDGSETAFQRAAVRRGDHRPDGGAEPDLPGLAAKTGLSAGYLNHLVHGNRPVPSDDVIATLAGALGVEPAYFREVRIRVITTRLEEMPALVDRLYRRLQGLQ